MAPDRAEIVYSAAGFGNHSARRAVKSLWAWGGAIRERVPVLVAIDARGAQVALSSPTPVSWAAARLGNLDRSRLESARACFYTVQPEERFLLEPMGRKGFVMSGFSGHGFKFGALMGEAMADMVLGQRDKDVVTPWAAGLASVA